MLIGIFFLSLLALYIQCLIIPKIIFFAFTPFLSYVNLLSNFPKALTLSILAGGCMDLFSNDPFGIHALNYTLTTAFFHRFNRYFLYEKSLHITLFTFLISSFTTLLGFLLLFVFDRRVPFNGKWFFTDLIGMPIIDGLFAFIWFSGPIILFQTLKKMVIVFWLKRKHRSLI